LPRGNLQIIYGGGMVFYYHSFGRGYRIQHDGRACKIAPAAFGGANQFPAD
jgi:hypothetical protein